jgi:hypothetical protein
MKSRRNLFDVTLITLLFLASLTGTGLAQDGWLNKPLEQWSKADVQKLLNDSPWARTQEARLDFGSEVRRIAGAPTTSSGHQSTEMGGANIAVDYRVTLRLRSALPIRQALVRAKQLEAKYDQMSPKERAAFDEKMKGLLDCPACAQNYVVTLSCKSTNYPGADALYDGLRGATLPGLKPYVHLENDRGERRNLVHFVAPRAAGEETIFFFPRFDDEDRPLVTPATRKLYFRLSDSNAKAITNFELDVTKLLLNGEIAF